ncbi:MAG: VCBS domain-containing protein [bacterium]|nr:VCBS domain-containing protein [bacterium]
MSAEIEAAFLNSMVARASYADIESAEQMLSRLVSPAWQSSMTPSMAQYFFSHYAFYASSLDAGSGYDGIVFQVLDGGELTNSYVLGNRGTQFSVNYLLEAVKDIAQDVLLAATGTNDQIDKIKSLINSIPIGATITTAGHSLGGFLSLWTLLLFNDRVNAAYTYNGAGIVNGYDVLNIINEVRVEAGLNPIDDVNSIGYYTPEFLELTATLGDHFSLLRPVNVDSRLSIEGLAETTLGHGIISLSNALLVAHVLGSVDESLSLEQANKIAESMGAQDLLDRNRTIAYLGELFYGASEVASFRNTNANEAQLQTMAFRLLSEVETVLGSIDDFNATIKTISNETSASLSSIARQEDTNGALMRHALLNLSSFALQSPSSTPPEMTTLLGSDDYKIDAYKDQVDASYASAHPETDLWENLAQMARWNALHNADAAVSPTLTTYVSDWNKDRDHEQVRVGDNVSAATRYFGGASVDVYPGSQGNDRIYGLAGDDTLKGGLGDDYLEGDIGKDELIGDDGNDVLMGGDGEDTLTGGTGSDSIYGGKGIDTYVWNTGDGVDRIIEADEAGNTSGGRLKLNGSIISSVKLDKATGLYKSSGFFFKDLGSNLFVFDAQKRLVLTVKNFDITSNNLGLKFVTKDGGGGGVILPGPKAPTTTPPPRDPLVVDLDGDGLETVGLAAGIMFDHGNDGVAENSGWVGEDDALLVRDLNGDGVINNGSELFGNFSRLKNRQMADNGFAALADLDSNGDGFVTEADTVDVARISSEDANHDGVITPDEVTTTITPESIFSQLRLWRDRNQNGQTDAGELLSLSEAGLSALSLAGNYQSVTETDGNVRRGTSFAITEDGHQITTGIYDFLASPVLRDFTDTVTIPPELQDLPNLQGTGSVRDLLEAAALSPELAVTLSGFVGGDFSTQNILLDNLILQWADSSDMVLALQEGRESTLIEQVWMNTPNEGIAPDAPMATLILDDGQRVTAPVYWSDAAYTDASRLLQQQFRVIEYFSGQSVRDWRNDSKTIVAAENLPAGITLPDGGVTVVTVGLTPDGMAAVQDYWVSLRHAVYENLVLMTRLSSYVEQINWDVAADGQLQPDFSALNATLDDLYQHHFNADTLADVVELFRFKGDEWRRFGWDGAAIVRQWVGEALAGGADVTSEGASPDAVALLARLHMLGLETDGLVATGHDDHLSLGGAASDSFTGGILDDKLLGGAGDDVLAGAAGNDLLMGESGNDVLHGGTGDDALVGGQGNDTLYGDSGADTYEYSRGDGNDVIHSASDLEAMSVLEFQGDISPDEVSLKREAGDLLVMLSDGAVIRVSDYFLGHGITLSFRSDLSQWSQETIKSAVQASTEGNDIIYGYAERNDVLDGAGGDDTLWGSGGDDVLLGADGNDRLFGEYGNDVLDGGAGRDQLNGGSGNDVLSGGDGNDDLVGGDGDDTLRADAGNDVLAGGYGNDTLIAGNDACRLYGDGGNDGLQGGAGDDYLAGGDGNDELLGGAGNDVLSGGSGINRLQGNAGNDQIYAGGNDTVFYRRGDGQDLITGGWIGRTTVVTLAFSDITSNEVEVWREGNSAIRIWVAGSDEWVTIQGIGSTTSVDLIQFANGVTWTAQDLMAMVPATPGDDTVRFVAGAGDVLQLLGGNDIATGSILDDYVDGNEGDDSLHGGAGNDVISGGAGTDSLYGDEGNDRLTGDAQDQLFGGDGNDTLTGAGLQYGESGNDQLYAAATGSLLDGGEGDDSLIGDDGADMLGGGNGDDSLIGGAGVDTLDGGNGNDSLSGGSDSDLLIGGEGDDHLEGGIGNDILKGDAGNDVLHGGDGVDTLDGGNGNDALSGGSDNDLLMGGEGDDHLDGGTGNDILEGNSGNDVLSGGNGDDVISGGDGNDYLYGDTGNDTLDGGEGEDVFQVDIGEITTLRDVDNSGWINVPGYSYEYSSFGYDLFFRSHAGNTWGYSPDDVEHFYKDVSVVYDLASQTVTMNGLDNETKIVIAGMNTDQPRSSIAYTIGFGGQIINPYDDSVVRDEVYQLDQLIARSSVVIKGAEDADIINSLSDAGVGDLPANAVSAGAGDDQVYGGSGDDRLFGEAGNDFLYGDAGNDQIDGGVGSDHLYGDFGNDTLAGGDGSDSLWGGADDDSLDGGAGADYMAGDDGNDTYFLDDVNDQVHEDADHWVSYFYWGYWQGYWQDNGNDTVVTALDYQLGDYLENLTLTGSMDLTGTGNDLDNIITGNSGNNILSGLVGNDWIYGMDGNDVLNAGSGSGAMYGGNGDDELNGSNDSGDLYGEAGNDILRGGDGYDLLDGGSGNDVMTGGLGSDTYRVDSAGDVVIDEGNDAYDAVESSVDYVLPEAVENLTLLDDYLEHGLAGNITGTGNELDNNLYGNAGSNQIFGGAGDDYLDGRGGDDVLVGGTGNDTLRGGDDAMHILFDDEAGTAELISLASNNDVLDGGEGDDNLDGGTGDDVLYGGDGNDVLYGGDQPSELIYLRGNEETYTFADTPLLSNNDLLDGGAGDDELSGGSGNDTLIGGSGSDFLYGDEGNDLLDGRDNEVTDYLEGGAGDDVYYIDGLPGTTSAMASVEGDITAGYLCNMDVVARPGAVGGVADIVIEGRDGGYDIVYSTVLIARPDNVEELHIIGDQALTGDVVFGTTDNDVLTGSMADNVIDGDFGADLMAGAAGNDTYVVDNVGDVVSEAADSGHDVIYTLIDNYQLTENVETLYLGTFDGLGLDSSAGGVYSGYGNDGDNRIRGNVYDNRISAGAGNDLLFGGGGNDILDGGSGDDLYVVQTNYQYSFASIMDSSGNDRLHFSGDVSYGDIKISFNSDGVLIQASTSNGGSNRVWLADWSLQNTTVDTLTFCGDANAYSLAAIAGNAPVAADDYASVSRSQFTSSGNVLANDRVAQGGVLQVITAGEYSGAWGSLSVASDGSYTYSLYADGADLSAIPAGQTLTDQFLIEVSDSTASSGALVSATSQLKISIADTFAPVAVADARIMTEDQAHISGNVLANDSSLSGAALTLAHAGVIQGQYGALSLLANGDYVYEQTGSQNALAAGEAVTDVFAYTVTDGALESSSSLTITIAGENDAPVAQADADSLSVADGALVGNVLVNDTDVDHGAVLQTVAASYTGQYGSLLMETDGRYHYVLNQDNPVLTALAEGESLSEAFNYDVTDGALISSATITLTVRGSNDAPVANVDAASMAEDQAAVAGNVLGNDSDVDHESLLSVVSSGEFAGQYGVLRLTAAGGWSYALNNNLEAVQTLTEGQLVSEVFAYEVTDGSTSAFSSLVVTIEGRNDAPVVTGETVLLDENTASLLSGNVLANDVDAEGDALYSTATTVQGQHGVFMLQTDGGWTYQADTSALQYLSAGQQVEDVITYSVNDGITSTAGDIRFVIEGRNDAPVTQDDAAAISVGAPAITGNVLGNDRDVDQGTVLQVMAADVQGQYGRLSLSADGSYHYVLNSSQPELVALAEGITLSESFAYDATDGMTSVAASLVVTIAGRNDAPVLSADIAALTEDAASVQGNVLGNDSDPDQGDILSAVPATLQGQYGALVIDNSGHYAYQLDNGLVQKLAEGQTVVDTFHYDATDGHATSSSVLAVTISGTNDAPVAAGDVAAITVGAASVSGNVLSNDRDVDQGTVLQAVAATLQGQYGTLSLSVDGTYQYALNSTLPSLVALAAGEFLAESFSYTATDGMVPVAGSLQVTIAGRNDAPQTIRDAGTLTEDTVSIQGNVLANDSDPDHGAQLRVASAGDVQGSYGMLHLNTDGSYAYQANTASLQSLAQGESVVETLSHQVTDGLLTTSSALTMTITGANDAPIVAQAIASQVATSGQAVAITVSTNTFTDIDHNDVLTYGVTLADGSALPSWLSFNAATRTFSGTASTAGTYQLRVTATDTMGATASTSFGLTVNAPSSGNIINGTRCDDTLTGSAGNDVIDGKGGNDTMKGLAGDDTYFVDANDSCGGDKVIELLNQGYDTVKSSVSYVLGSNVEALQLLGSSNINGTGNSLANWLLGNSGCNDLSGDDGNDHLQGGAGNDRLYGGNGVDLLQGGAGNDALADTNGNGLLDGGEGTDTLTGNLQNQFFVGGRGNDTITLGGGRDVIAFNRGDGQDRITDIGARGGSLTISLGGGIAYSDLTFRRTGNDLILNTGSSESITFSGWYVSGANRPVVTLQAVAESMASFSQSSSNPMLDDRLETFQFNNVVSAFDTANRNGTLTTWGLTNALAQFQLAGSDTVALGGNLAYQYGMTSSLNGMGAVSAQNELASAAFAAQAQTLQPLSGLSEGMSKLG